MGSHGLAAGQLWQAVFDGLTDGDLLVRYTRDRDEAAFAELVRRHGPLVYGVCRRIAGNGPDADDAFQAVFLVLVRKAGRIGRPDRLANWLFGVATRVARTARRRSSDRRRVERPLTDLPVPTADTTDPPADWREVLHAEVARLPEHYRAAVLLCDLGGQSRRAAARSLGIPDGTLSNRLARARALLGRRLLRRGWGPTAVLGSVAAVPDTLVRAAVTGPPSDRVLSLTTAGVTAMTPVRWLTVVVGLLGVAVGGAALLTAGSPPDDRPANARPDQPQEPTPVPGMGGYTIALSPDGKQLAVSEHDPLGRKGKEPAITFFDTATLKPVRRLSGPGDVCGTLLFSPDGKTAFVRGPDRITLHCIEVATWQVRGKLDPDSGHLLHFALSPDGKMLATAYLEARTGKPRLGSTRVALWGAETFAHRLDLDAGDVVPYGPLAFSPNGKQLAVGYSPKEGGGSRSAGAIEFDPTTGKELRRCAVAPHTEKGHSVVVDMAYSPDGSRIALAGGEAIPVAAIMLMLDGRFHVWERQAGRVAERSPVNPGDYFRRVIYSPDGRRVFLGSRGQTQRSGRTRSGQAYIGIASKVQCWTAPNLWDIKWSVDGESGEVSGMALDPTGANLFVADDGGVWVYDPATGRRRGGLIRTERDD